MEIKDFLRIAKIINDFAQKVGLWNSYIQLRNSLTQYNQQFQANPNNQSQLRNNFEQNRQLLLGQLKQLQDELKNLKEIKNIKKLNLDEIFGEKAINSLNTLQFDLQNNPNIIIPKINELITKATQCQQLFNSMNNVFGIDFNIEIEQELNNEFILHFENGANIETLKELSKASQDWQVVVNCMSRLVRDNESEAKIVSVDRGSIILTVTAISAIIYALSNSSNKILDVILKVYEVKKKALELKQLKLSTINDAINILEKQAKLNVVSEANTITDELLEEYKWTNADELFNETKTAVNKAIRRMIRFTNAGGKIETKLINPTAEESESIKQLKEKTKLFIKAEDEVFKLEGKKELLQLEDKIENEDEEGDKKSAS